MGEVVLVEAKQVIWDNFLGSVANLSRADHPARGGNTSRQVASDDQPKCCNNVAVWVSKKYIYWQLGLGSKTQRGVIVGNWRENRNCCKYWVRGACFTWQLRRLGASLSQCPHVWSVLYRTYIGRLMLQMLSRTVANTVWEAEYDSCKSRVRGISALTCGQLHPCQPLQFADEVSYKNPVDTDDGRVTSHSGPSAACVVDKKLSVQSRNTLCSYKSFGDIPTLRLTSSANQRDTMHNSKICSIILLPGELLNWVNGCKGWIELQSESRVFCWVNAGK